MLAKEHFQIYRDICYLTNEETKNYAKLLKYGEDLDIDIKRKFLWLWPDEKDLNNIKDHLKKCNIECILSVGCGNGLLEWILKESLGIEVYGLEIDRKWWQSTYSVHNFIKLNFVEDIKEGEEESFFFSCCHKKKWNFALLFCYFNNRTAFLNYLKIYKGNSLILLGPMKDIGVHADPLPLQPQFPKNSLWCLKSQIAVGNNDVIAFYEKLCV